MSKKLDEIIEIASKVVPSERQVKWQETEFYAFIHFGLNTFYEKEHGSGNDDLSAFSPYEFDANQWTDACHSAGMKGLILTCKHHDGFCLWPSKFTDYTVANTPFQDGKGDIVKDVAEACKNAGLKFGVYLSPWDRHEETYGTGAPYDNFFSNQLTELLTNYGDIFEVWFDGCCGEGKNGKKQNYDWTRYYKIVRTLQPEAVIAISGPDVRWVGNEAGITRPSEWSVLPCDCDFQEGIEIPQNKNKQSKYKDKNSMCLDLGSRKAIKDAQKLCWYPAEVDVSIRDNWFYHKCDDPNIKSLEKLKKIYFNSVGANATLLLNIPPNKFGKIPSDDVKTLQAFGADMEMLFANSVLDRASVSTNAPSDEHPIENILSEKVEDYYCSGEFDGNIEIVVEFSDEKLIRTILLQENIRTGQQIEGFKLSYLSGNKWKTLDKYTVIGYKKIIHLQRPILCKKFKITITDYRKFATLNRIDFFK